MIAFPLSRDAVFKHAVRYESPVEGAVTIATALVAMWLTSMAWVFIEPRPESEVVLDLLTEFGDRFSGQILAARFLGLLHYLSRVAHDLFGHSDEFTILLGLLFVPLLGRHPLDFLHATSCHPLAIVEPPNPLLDCFFEAADQTCDHAYDIP